MGLTIEQAVILGDLIELTIEQKVEHYKNVCKALKLDWQLSPLDYITVPGKDGKSKVILFAKKAASDALKKNNGINITHLDKEITEELVLFTAYAEDKDGGTDISTGVGHLKGKRGNELANAIMTAETKAKRRVILSISGTGLLDETEVMDMSKVTVVDSGMGVPASPLTTPAVNNAPAAEVKLNPADVESAASDARLAQEARVKIAEEIIAEKLIEKVQEKPVEKSTEAQGQLIETALEKKEVAEKAEPISLNAEQLRDKVRNRINAYKRDVLPTGGLRPSKGMGINAKLAKYYNIKSGDTNMEQTATEKLIAITDILDSIQLSGGPEAVAKEVEQAIAA